MQSFFVATVFALASVPAIASAQSHHSPLSYRSTAPMTVSTQDHHAQGQHGKYNNANYVWVEAQVHPNGQRIDGFYRLRHRKGMTWRAGHYRGTTYIPCGWQPTRLASGKTWIPGHRGSNGYWVTGRARSNDRSGYQWVAGHYHRGAWIAGHWRTTQQLAGTPSRARRVSGYRDTRGRRAQARNQPAWQRKQQRRAARRFRRQQVSRSVGSRGRPGPSCPAPRRW